MPKKPKTLLKQKIFFAATLLNLSGCQSVSGPVPKIDVKLYNGDSAKGGVTRANPGEPVDTIKATDPRIDEGYWLRHADFNRVISTYIGQCEKWKPGTVLIDADLLWQQVKP
jgi:hypothetical protein